MVNKKILITGAASGIGYLCTQYLLAENVDIIAVDINKNALAKMKKDFAQYNKHLFTHVCDLSDKKDLDKTCTEILQQHEYIDVLVNNAGIVNGKPFLQLNDEHIQKSMDINIMANIWLTRAFLPTMIKRNNGQVIFISSAAAFVGVNKLSVYCASKCASFGFAESLRMEMKAQKSAVNISIVAPFYIKTGMFAGVKSRFSFLLPLLEPHHATKKIIGIIHKPKPLLIMPFTVRLIWPLRIFGIPIFDAVANFLGINQTMAAFVGRTPQHIEYQRKQEDDNNKSNETKKPFID